MGFKIVRTKKKVKKTEFSKRVIGAMTVVWFLTALYGGVIVWINGYGLESLLSYVGAPMTGGIVGYMLKSAMENKEKIQRDIVLNTEGEDHP